MKMDELIVLKLTTLENNLKEIDEKVNLCRIEIAGLKVKSGIWGAIAGMIPAAIGVGMWIISLP